MSGEVPRSNTEIYGVSSFAERTLDISLSWLNDF